MELRKLEWDSIFFEVPVYALHLTSAVTIEELYEKIGTRLISRLERFARALCRLFTIGGLGPEAAQYTGIIAPFLFLSDDKLGTRSY